MLTWFNGVIRETLDGETVSEETVTVQQQVKTTNSESVTVDSFELYPSLPSKEELDTEPDMEETSGNHPLTEFQIIIQKMGQK